MTPATLTRARTCPAAPRVVAHVQGLIPIGGAVVTRMEWGTFATTRPGPHEWQPVPPRYARCRWCGAVEVVG
jgi:hypothetical protein